MGVGALEPKRACKGTGNGRRRDQAGADIDADEPEAPGPLRRLRHAEHPRSTAAFMSSRVVLTASRASASAALPSVGHACSPGALARHCHARVALVRRIDDGWLQQFATRARGALALRPVRPGRSARALGAWRRWHVPRLEVEAEIAPVGAAPFGACRRQTLVLRALHTTGLDGRIALRGGDCVRVVGSGPSGSEPSGDCLSGRGGAAATHVAAVHGRPRGPGWPLPVRRRLPPGAGQRAERPPELVAPPMTS